MTGQRAFSAAIARSEYVTHGRRGASRARLLLPGRLVSFNGTMACTVFDASQTGAKIACAELPRIGSTLVVELPPVEFFGTVAWIDDGLFGLKLDEPLAVEEIIELRRQADTFDRSEEIRALRLVAREFVQGRI